MEKYRLSVLHGKGKLKKENKDFYHCYLDSDTQVFVLLDGASSLVNSRKGAEHLAKFIIEFVLDNYEDIYTNSLDRSQRMLAVNIYNELYHLAEKEDMDFESLGSTLICLAFKENSYISLHIGDGVILAEKGGELLTLSPASNGMLKRYTYLSTSKNLSKHVKLRRGKSNDYEKYILLTDGFGESFAVEKIFSDSKGEYDFVDDYTAFILEK